MARILRPVSHDETLSLVEHLDELRTRLIVVGITLFVAFGVCFWQNHALIHILNRPLLAETKKSVAQGKGPAGQTALAQQAVLKLAATVEKITKVLEAPSSQLSANARTALRPLARQARRAVAAVPKTPTGDLPITIGIGEPFTATVTVSLYFALLFSLPVILYQLYGFVLPAFSPKEQAVAMPVMLGVPVLLLGGVAFGYFIVLPAAVHFLQNFNASQFNVLVQATNLYRFEALVLLAMGLIFQVPVAVIACVRAEIVTTRQLRHNRRYAIVIAAAIAALLPGDVVTMLLETLPIIVLYEVSILIASLLDRRDARRERAAVPAPSPPPPPPPVHLDDAL